jgi:hypothetical protein
MKLVFILTFGPKIHDHMIHANLHNRFILVEFISHKITPIALKQFFIPWPFKSHILKLKDENY